MIDPLANSTEEEADERQRLLFLDEPDDHAEDAKAVPVGAQRAEPGS